MEEIEEKEEINEDEIININNESNIKTSIKVINALFINQTDSNLSLNNKFKSNPHLSRKSAIFSNFKSLSKKDLIKEVSGHFNQQRRASIINFRNNQKMSNNPDNKININDNSNRINIFANNNQKKKINYIKYNDLYFEDDMFIPESSSFPNEKEADFLLKLQFIEDNDYNEDFVDYSIRNNSINYKTNNNNKNNFNLKNFYNQNNENIINKSNLKINGRYYEEKEEIGKNVEYLDKPKERISWVNLEKKDFKMNNTFKGDLDDLDRISYISLDLLIKKVAIENFYNDNTYTYTCFTRFFKYLIPLDIFVEKLISAYDYYNRKSIDTSGLIFMLNDIIFQNYDLIKEDKKILEQIQIFIIKIKNVKFEEEKVNQQISFLNYLLFSHINDNSINNNNIINDDREKNSKNKKKKDNIFKKFLNLPKKIKIGKFFSKIKIKKRNKISDMDSKEIKKNDKKHSYHYFYIFDYTKEEIAVYLTLESYELLSNIPEKEFFNKNFCCKEKDKLAPNIMKIIERSDKLILFILEDICSYNHSKERAEVIEKWVRIAYVCKDLNNFNDLIMLNGLFCNYLLKKMKRTRKALSKNSLISIEKLKKFCSGNQCYLIIRKEIVNCKCKPYIPYLGIILKQIMSVEEMKSTINNNINIQKLIKFSKIIDKFFDFRQRKYPFEKPKNLENLNNSNLFPKSEDEIESIVNVLETKLISQPKKGDKKRITLSDKNFYS